MLKKIQLNILFLLIFALSTSVGLNSEHIINQERDIFDLKIGDLDLESFSDNDLKEFAEKSDQIAKIFDNVNKIENLKKIQGEHKKLLWFKKGLFNNFIINGVSQGVTGIIKTVVVPRMAEVLFFSFLFSRLSGISVTPVFRLIWALLTTPKLAYLDKVPTIPMQIRIPIIKNQILYDKLHLFVAAKWNIIPRFIANL